ncbi:MAG TPA: hypothetical protein VEC38_06020 [Candidatus Binataceae bacterium]|nr:hypothetical protein [Candidatus Binataceae bacterium]
MNRLFSISMAAAILLGAALAWTAESGTLKLDVLGDVGADAQNRARVLSAGGKQVGEVTAGKSIQLPPGDYALVLPIVGGEITKSDVKIEPGRTHTVLIDNVAVLQVSAKDRAGTDPGFGVTVTSSAEPHGKIASFITGDKYLFAPMLVDVKVDAPPQGYYWHALALKPGERSRLTLGEVVPADLDVQTTMAKQPINDQTRVVIYRGGTQSRVAESAPGPAHHFALDPGDYDIFVENHSGKGRPYVSAPRVHLESGAKVEREVPMD